MKITKLFVLAGLLFVGQSALANKFVFYNHLATPIAGYVGLLGKTVLSDMNVPAGRMSKPIDTALGLKMGLPVTKMGWICDGENYLYIFPSPVALPIDKKNFFNVYENGKAMHNFGGYKANVVGTKMDYPSFVNALNS